jgi:hypothetical protein
VVAKVEWHAGEFPSGDLSVRVCFYLNDFWRYSLVTHPIYFNQNTENSFQRPVISGQQSEVRRLAIEIKN